MKKLFRKTLSIIPLLFACTGFLGFSSLADTAKREEMGNSAANLSAASGSGWMTYDDQFVYFASSGSIYRTPLSGGSTVEIYRTESGNRSFDGLNLDQGFLYFTDGFTIWKLDLESGTRRALTDSALFSEYHNMILLDETLYYTNWDGQLWRMNLDGSGQSLVMQLNDASQLGDDQRIDLHFQSQYAFSDGYLYYCTLDSATKESAALVRVPLSGGTEAVVAPARSDPPGGDYAPDPAFTTVWEPFAPVPDGDWIYYIEDYETRTRFADGGQMRFLTPIGGLWRVHPDGSGRELLYQNKTPDVLTHDQLVFGPVSNEKGIKCYTVRDNKVFLVREGSISTGTLPDMIYKLENGALTPIYTAPAPTERTDSQIISIATAPEWIYFTLINQSWTEVQAGGYTEFNYAPSIRMVYRMRYDGSGLECLAQGTEP